MPLKAREVKISVKDDGKAVERKLKMVLRELRPAEDSILVLHGLPARFDPQAIMVQIEKSGAIPPGRKLLILPENMNLEEVPVELLNGLGYYKVENDDRPEDSESSEAD